MSCYLLRSLADKLRGVSIKIVAEWRKEDPLVAIGAFGRRSAVVHGLWSTLVWDKGFVCVHLGRY